MFIAGYEIDFARVRGAPLDRAVRSWLVSVGRRDSWIGAILAFDGCEISDLFIGTRPHARPSIGALIPILDDADVLDQPFGSVHARGRRDRRVRTDRRDHAPAHR